MEQTERQLAGNEDMFADEVHRIKVGKRAGSVATGHTTPTFQEFMESGASSAMPMQPGEGSWASWKCGGGPHQGS